jgi:hypothetical protein
MKIFFAITCGLFALACAKSPDPKSPSNQGKTCGSGSNAIVCAANQFCGHGPAPPPLNRTAPVRPEDPVGSDVGGSCGGIAGFHCRAGTICQMSPDQDMAADGMGTCVLPWTCVNGSF